MIRKYLPADVRWGRLQFDSRLSAFKEHHIPPVLFEYHLVAFQLVVAKILLVKVGEFGVGGGVHVQELEHRPIFFSQRVDVLVRDFALPDRLVVFDDRADFDGDGGVGGLDVLVEVADSPSSADNKFETSILVRRKQRSA